VNNRWSALAAAGLTVAIMLATSRIQPQFGHRWNWAYGPVIDVLREREVEPGTRFYASPNHHLIWTYYTGIPVQSVAPVRREFFESFPHPIVFLETVVWGSFVDPYEIGGVLVEHGESPDAKTVVEIQNAIWANQALVDVSKRDIPIPPPVKIPSYLDDLVTASRLDWEKGEARFVEQMQRDSACFRQVEVDRASDIWMSFFYRFSGYKDRIGTKANIISRLRNSEVLPVPRSSMMIFFCRPLTATASAGETTSE
jgi:hypothetical protein